MMFVSIRAISRSAILGDVAAEMACTRRLGLSQSIGPVVPKADFRVGRTVIEVLGSQPDMLVFAQKFADTC